MANNSVKLSQIQPKNNADGSDVVVAYSVVSNNDVLVPVSNLYTNTVLMSANLVLMQNNTPANSTANTLQHSLWSDGSFIYYAVSNNVIKRVALSSF